MVNASRNAESAGMSSSVIHQIKDHIYALSIRRSLQEKEQEFASKNPEKNANVTVFGDLKTAKIYVSVLQDNKKQEALAGLQKAQGFIRREIARRINLRNTPELIFKLDESIERGIEMSKLIDDVIAKDSEH